MEPTIYYLLIDIRDRLKRIEQQLTPPSPVVRFEFYVEGLGKVNEMNLKVSQKVLFSVKPVDKGGNVALVDGAPAWSLTDPSLGSFLVSEDGMSASLVPSGSLGGCEVQVHADADLGEGVKDVLGSIPVSFLAGDAVALNVSAGEPEDV